MKKNQALIEISKTCYEIANLLWQDQPKYYIAQALADLSLKILNTMEGED